MIKFISIFIEKIKTIHSKLGKPLTQIKGHLNIFEYI